jgi:hypothetical protein
VVIFLLSLSLSLEQIHSLLRFSERSRRRDHCAPEPLLLLLLLLLLLSSDQRFVDQERAFQNTGPHYIQSQPWSLPPLLAS